ncbi:MAG TPA: ferrous iron transport protein B [Bacillota bacterium]
MAVRRHHLRGQFTVDKVKSGGGDRRVGYELVGLPPGARRIVLVGNPNTGKSVFFNAFTGLYVDVSNFPGTTVEVSSGRLGQDVVLDTPGIYGVSSFNDEERVARDVILAADLVINVVNGSSLERDLFLTLQLIDMGLPLVVAVNMVDEAERHGLRVDYERLRDILGVPVVPTVATAGRGLDTVRRMLDTARPGRPDPDTLELCKRAGELAGTPEGPAARSEALLMVEDDPTVLAEYGGRPTGRREEVYGRRRKRVDALVAEVVRREQRRADFGRTLSDLSLSPLAGTLIVFIVLLGLYELIGVLAAQKVVGFTEDRLMRGYYEPWIRGLLAPYLAAGGAAAQFLTGEFGLLTMTVTYVVGLLFPLVVAFYLGMSLLEDSGYLPRLATLVDREMMRIGLNGRAVIPVILGFGCVTMAIITTRLLGTARERTIAVALLALTIPCSAQLGVIAGMMAGVGPLAVLIFVGTIAAIFALAGTILDRLLPGVSSDLFIDLPPLRLPRVGNVLQKTWAKTVMFLRDAGPLFVYGSLVISFLKVTGWLADVQGFLAPLTVGWLHLPREAATAFIMGIVRRDFGAAGLSALTLDAAQKVTAVVTITLFVPCIAAVMVIFKERGSLQALIVWASSFVVAFLAGGLIGRLAEAVL